ncbi:hypothetical protein JCM5353_002333 [Sporobolomyces roseus]
MAEHLRQTFQTNTLSNRPTFVAFLTAGFPSPDQTVPLMLAMERGGAEVIELGVPFSDPLADGKTIQEANTVALSHGVNYKMCYYNPILAYEEKAAVVDAREAGASGFIIGDLPPEEGVNFRGLCREEGLSFIPLIAPSTTDDRIRYLSTIADSFIYVVSRMGPTGAQDSINSTLPSFLDRIRSSLARPTPLAVGFGVSTRAHFEEIGAVADGVVIGSRLINIVKESKNSGAVKAVEDYCSSVSSGRTRKGRLITPQLPTPPVSRSQSNERKLESNGNFGLFGGSFVPEALNTCLAELKSAYEGAKADPEFWEEFRKVAGERNGNCELEEARGLTRACAGARIWLKPAYGLSRNPNVIGQVLLARRMGKMRIVAETGSGVHGLAVASVCEQYGFECVIYIGETDAERYPNSLDQIRSHGAQVKIVCSGTRKLKDAINDLVQDWVVDLETTYYLTSMAVSPAPYPTIVRDFQSLIGNDVKAQHVKPDAIVACVGSSAIGAFHPFIDDKSIRLIAVEAAGLGLETDSHSAALSKGSIGVFHGSRTYLLQTAEGQISSTHSIASDLDYPAVPPELAYLYSIRRLEPRAVTDEEASMAKDACNEYKLSEPSKTGAHAVWAAMELSKEMSKEANIVVIF